MIEPVSMPTSSKNNLTNSSIENLHRANKYSYEPFSNMECDVCCLKRNIIHRKTTYNNYYFTSFDSMNLYLRILIQHLNLIIRQQPYLKNKFKYFLLLCLLLQTLTYDHHLLFSYLFFHRYY